MSSNTKKYAEVAVEAPVEGTFTYSVSGELLPVVRLGCKVTVPFGRRTVTGHILGLSSNLPTTASEDFDGGKVKDIGDVIDTTPLFGARRLRFLRWLSAYYFAPIGEVIKLITPPPAGVKVIRYFTITEAGLKPVGSSGGVLKKRRGTSGEVLRVLGGAKGAKSLKALSTALKGRPVSGVLASLKKEGLVTEELRIEGGSIKVEKVVTLAPSAPSGGGGGGDYGEDYSGDCDDRLSGLKGRLQREVYAYLFELLSESEPLSRSGSGTTPIGAPACEVTLKEIVKRFPTARPVVSALEAKGLLEVKEREVKRDPFAGITGKSADFTPTPLQKEAIEALIESVASGTFSPFLLHGVTGSGKTFVYLKVLDEVIRLGKKGLFLVPEISLTPWPVAYLKDRYPGRVAVMHSGLSKGERFDEFRRIQRGEVDIVVGARSALFAPLKDIGLIIVDEEHDTSYKQEEGVRYHGRDSALMLGQYLGATVVLGSATPSVETFYNGCSGRYKVLTLPGRVGSDGMPHIEVVDMRGRKGDVLSPPLQNLLKDNMDGGDQGMLFLNRRGYSHSLICHDCGYYFMCPNCSVSLTFHKGSKKIKCHYCDYWEVLPESCPECNSVNVVDPGAGTERVEEIVEERLPGARVIRMDRDTTSKRGSVKGIIDKVESHEVDILVGTQMVSKGHHFPGITVVGIVSGDTSLSLPDFRAGERTFQLICQAAGRAGRGGGDSHVIIQSLSPDHGCFGYAAAHDYEGFYREEVGLRELAGYPPFTRLCMLRFDGLSEERVLRGAERIRALAESLPDGRRRGITVLGPAPAVMSRLKNRYRYNILIKGSDVKVLHRVVSTLKHNYDLLNLRKGGVTLTIDMDPLSVV